MIEQLKHDVCAIAKKAQTDGLCKHKSGNFSARDPKTGYIAVSPSGIDRDILTHKDIIVMDGLQVVENLSNLKPSSEVLVHLEVYKTRPDIHAIVHTHSKYATAFAVAQVEIPAIVFEISILNLKRNSIPLAPYQLPGTTALAKATAQATLDSDAILMARHGTLAVAQTIQEAYLKAAYLEELAEIYFLANTINPNLQIFQPSELEKHAYPKEIQL